MPDPAESEFVGLLYDAALNRVPRVDVVSGMARILEAETSSLFTHDPIAGTSDILGMHNNADDYIKTYASTFVYHALWTHEALRRRHYGQATIGSELVSDSMWRRSVIYNEFLRARADAFYLVGSLLRLRGGNSLAIGCQWPSSVNSQL